MNIAQISDNLEKLVETFDKDSFIFDLLLAFGTPKATISRLQQGESTMFLEDIVAIKKKVYFRSVENEDLQGVLDEIKTNEKVAKIAPRFILVTNFENLLSYDTKTDESLDIPILEIPKYYDFFLPWAGMEKAQHVTENPADVKAAERMAKLYDEIKKENPTNTPEEVHNLNVFLSRLLFCFFAEDTGIFEKNIFTKSIDSHTQVDGSDLNVYLDRLFEVMNTPQSARGRDEACLVSELPAYLNAFPYVNGGLFRNSHNAPIFTRRSRQMLIDSGNLQWQDINPDIFGSMIQAVITPEHRGGLGMHYTSVPNIMKVIEPLFLDELKAEFETAKGNKKKLNDLLKRIWKIKIFDPACGSGNFLIIAYKELRKLEMLIFKELGTFAFSEINLGNFYGIELDDFAHEIATLSLWLAEHQMNQIFRREFGDAKPALPLQETGNIVNGNACRVDWETVCPKIEGDEIYILGNPPYLGSRNQDDSQKEDLDFSICEIKFYRKLDYIAVWFYKAAQFIINYNSKSAFVSTNSICQGEQLGILWKSILNVGVEIDFAHTDFKWTNNAKNNAGVTVVIIGLRNLSKLPKLLFTNEKIIKTQIITPNLEIKNAISIEKRTIPLSDFPNMRRGNMPNDQEFLRVSPAEYNQLIRKYPEINKIIKKQIGADEYINSLLRYCFWISDKDLIYAQSIPEVKTAIENCYNYRINSKDKTLHSQANKSHQFREFFECNENSLLIPIVSSENRNYIPIGFVDKDTIIPNSAQVIYNANIVNFGVITSRMHNLWVKYTAGRLENRFRYSIFLCYNTFPFPTISEKQKKELEQHVYNIIGERAKNEPKTLAQLYDPDKMPDGLLEAHLQNDLAVERCYRSRPFESDEERLEYLFKLYEQMIEEEKERGTLFGKHPKSPKKRGLK